VKLLLERKADMESEHEQYFYKRPLSLAADNEHEHVVKVLLESKANIDSTDTMNRTSLSWAAERGDRAVAELLLKRNGNTEHRDYDGNTPLALAVMYGPEAIVNLLLEEMPILTPKLAKVRHRCA